MTFGEAKTLVSLFLKGDNKDAIVDTLIVNQALLEVATRCEPQRLVTTEEPTNLYRKIIDSDGNIVAYIRMPVIGDDTAELDIDRDLQMAVVFFICAYLSNKSKDYYEAKAERLISIYKANSNAV